jgi:cell shape-determining protein MreC
VKRTFFVLPLLLFSFLSLPQHSSDRIRSKAIAWLQPLWSLGQAVRTPLFPVEPSADPKELQSLQLENYQQRAQLDRVYEWLASDKRLRDQVEIFRSLQKETPSDFLSRRAEEMKALLQAQAMAAPSRVLYRDPTSWSSSCWIDAGEENNLSLGRKIIAKNSPVVVGSALVGIIEYVGKTQSRVRLITDSGLKTAVRAVRGSILDREIAISVKSLLDRLKTHPKFKEASIAQQLVQFQEQLSFRFEDGYFAKGEICGSSAIFQRSLGAKLKGVGFNCDVADLEGPSRDLRDRAVLHRGDLLVTSGLDGVFPPGLKVGYVTESTPLREGAYSYELEAEPAAGPLSDLTSVFVLPPLTVD